MEELSEDVKKKLRENGRGDLIKIHNIMMSGKEGINLNGTIVSLEDTPDAIPIPPNNPFLSIHPEEAIKRRK